MENTVTMKLEDYDNMKASLEGLADFENGIYKSITRYTKNKEGNIVEQSTFTGNRDTIRITINKEKLLSALGFNQNIAIDFQ